MVRKGLVICAALVAFSCGKDETSGNNGSCAEAPDLCSDVSDGPDTAREDMATAIDMSTQRDMGTADLGGGDLGDPADMSKPTSCNRMPRPANGPRKVIVALPFTNTQYEVFDLDAAGELTRPNVTFAMGEGQDGGIQFTPDGEVGFAVQDDGTLGVFRINASGQPEVLAAKHDPGFYVSGALVDATGDNLYAWETGFRKLDDGTANGALYRLPITCASGTLAPAVEVLRAKLMRAASWTADNELAIAAVDLLDDVTPNDVHLVNLDGPTRLGSQSAFPDDESIAAGFGVTRDGNYMLIGDNSAFSGIPNRVGVVGIQGDQLFAQQVIDIPDPTRIFTSPYDNAAIVLSTTDDTINVLDYNPGAAVSAFSLRGPLATTAPVLLPFGGAMITRGDLEGLVIIGENVGIRRVRFETNGDVTDLGLLELGSGVESITGAIGVQP